ncbi:MAG: BolA family protein [Gammaproteobacteria bacterium]
MTLSRIEKIKQALGSLHPDSVEVVDNSHLHRGHVGAQSGKGHFALSITSSCFEGKTQIQRHRMIYNALSDLMDTDIHAIEIKAYNHNKP